MTIKILELLRYGKRELAAPAFQAVHLDFAFACTSCKFIIDGADRGHCKRCGSAQIFRVRAVLDRVVTPIQKRLHEVARKKQTQHIDRQHHNPLALLTEFRRQMMLRKKKHARMAPGKI